ncbi:MAG: hypothetical protein AAF557_27145 [Pseudomonadota bacterium]
MATIIREDLSDQFIWTRIEDTIDQSTGQDVLTDRFTLFDTGVEWTETFFANGVRSSLTQEDNPGAVGNGEAGWSSITTKYDIDGVIQDRRVVFDNGVEQQYERRASEISILQLDNPGDTISGGAKSWSSYLGRNQQHIRRRRRDYESNNHLR